MRALCIILMASLLPVVPAGATDFYFHLSWEKDVEVTHATAQPGDTLRVFIRVDTTENLKRLTLDRVEFGLWSDCSLTHLESKSLNDDIDVACKDLAGCILIEWTPVECGVHIAAITEYVSEHLFRVDVPQESDTDYHLGAWCPSFMDPFIYFWQYSDCTGFYGEMFAVSDQIYLDVTVPNEDTAWGAVKSLYRAP